MTNFEQTLEPALDDPEVHGAAAAAHEINNPLTVVVGYVQLLAAEVDAAERGRIDEMLKAVSRIQEIVTRIARVTRVELTENVLYLPRDA